jgi:hypothetical protein
MINPYAIVGGLLLAIALYFSGQHVGRKLERSTWQAKELATAAATTAELQAAQAKYIRAQSFNEATARKASADYANSLAVLTQKYDAARAAIAAAGGLRVSRSICAGADAAATQTTGAGRPDGGAAGTVALPDETQRRLFELTAEADALADRLRALQGWIVANGMYGEAK